MKFQIAKVHRYGRFMGYGIAVDGNLLDGRVSTTADTDAKGTPLIAAVLNINDEHAENQITIRLDDEGGSQKVDLMKRTAVEVAARNYRTAVNSVSKGRMMQVITNGIEYLFVANGNLRTGIAITTYQWPGVLKRATDQYMKHLPADAPVVVVDDGSSPAAVVPSDIRLLRHDKSLGIVASKNASLPVLMDAGCEYLFLWGDDAWPIADN